MAFINKLHKSIHFKFGFFMSLFAVAAVASIYEIMHQAILQMEKTLIASRLLSDINYIEDSLGSGEWNVRSGALYLGDTLIGDGTEERAHLEPFLEHERKTGILAYVFVKRESEGLSYVESTPTQKGYHQGHYLRVAGSTRDPNGNSIVGTYIDKRVADALDARGLYEGEANVAGNIFYCRYSTLQDKDGNVVGGIVVGRNVAELQKHARDVVNTMSAGILTAILLLSGTLFLFVNRWISTIHTILIHLKSIEEGHIPDASLEIHSDDEMGTLVTGINHMVDSLREKEALRRQSEIDPLTGLANRFGLNRRFEAAFEDCYRNRRTLTVGIMDIDFFKPFNDNYGHPAGDECILILARILKEMEEKYGVFGARFGGDEFIIICSGLERSEVEAIARDIKSRVLEQSVPHAFSRVADIVTISQGYCHGVPTQRKKLTDYLYMADGAMYDVKEGTKNGFKLVEMTDEFRPMLSCRFDPGPATADFSSEK